MKDLQFRSSKSQVMNINMKTFVRVIHFPFMKEEKRTRNSKLNKKKKSNERSLVSWTQFVHIHYHGLRWGAAGGSHGSLQFFPSLLVLALIRNYHQLLGQEFVKTHSTYHDYEKEIFKEINIFGWVLEVKESVTHRVANTWQQWTKIGSTWQLRAM